MMTVNLVQLAGELQAQEGCAWAVLTVWSSVGKEEALRPQGRRGDIPRGCSDRGGKGEQDITQTERHREQGASTAQEPKG